ncbi:MAG: sigma-70 family RNA polymerase sigma factor [Thermoanaerobaculia bacterium]
MTNDLPLTELLERWSSGDSEAASQLLPVVYEELKKIAVGLFAHERGDHTLQATALVHEAYLRLAEGQGFSWPSRNHFYSFAAHLIRRILVDHARNRNRLKRGGQAQRASLVEVADLGRDRPLDLVALDDALHGLAARDPLKARIVELRFFAGLTLEETAQALGVSSETIGRHWRLARAWLFQELAPGFTPQPASG